MKRRLISFIIAILITVSVSPSARAMSTVDPKLLRGADYTDIPALAARLDAVFSGAPALYSDPACSVPASARIGYRDVPVGRTLYTRDSRGNVYSGSSCYIYANAVYSALFGDVPYHGESSAWQNSRRVLGSAESVSCDLFLSNGVSFGALMRTTPNADGSYSSNYGHSVIILSYNKSAITYLEGNGDGRGLVRVSVRDWADFDRALLKSKGYRVSFIVQPTAGYYDALRRGSVPKNHDFVGYFSQKYAVGYRDVSLSAWYVSGVYTASSVGLMNGRESALFVPSGSVTVAEAVTMCARFLSGYYDDRHDFSGGSSWYEPYYAYCALWGIDTSFASPGSAITRADFARLMDRALPQKARTDSVLGVSFSDASNAQYPYIYALAKTGILRGDGGTFRPLSPITRAEAACVLARMADRSLR